GTQRGMSSQGVRRNGPVKLRLTVLCAKNLAKKDFFHTLERQTQSPSAYGITRRSTKSRVQVSSAVSASCPTPSTDSKTLA
ncbi:hypothetical protein KUCAC02_015417, partial [Chaenocephalus aceratus]